MRQSRRRRRCRRCESAPTRGAVRRPASRRGSGGTGFSAPPLPSAAACGTRRHFFGRAADRRDWGELRGYRCDLPRNWGSAPGPARPVTLLQSCRRSSRFRRRECRGRTRSRRSGRRPACESPAGGAHRSRRDDVAFNLERAEQDHRDVETQTRVDEPVPAAAGLLLGTRGECFRLRAGWRARRGVGAVTGSDLGSAAIANRSREASFVAADFEHRQERLLRNFDLRPPASSASCLLFASPAACACG